MTMAYTFAFTLAVILNSIELSSQTDTNPNSKRNSGSFSSARQHSPDQTSAEEPALRSRSRSPQGRDPSFKVLGYGLEELGYIRLSPRTNQSLQFEFRRYIIPVDKPIRVRAVHNNYVPVPMREHIVLSTSNGDIFAILEYSGVLRGIYRTDSCHSRVKINMISGAVENMSSDEIRNIPIGENHPIFPQTFTKVVTNRNSLQFELNPDSERYPGSSFCDNQPSSVGLTSPERLLLRGRSSSPPGRLPSQNVLGYALGQLGYVRLVPRSNQNRRFEFRRYVFPIDKRIQLLVGYGKFVPVPTREHIVLSTSNGEVFAILEYTGIFRGIYKTNRNHSRVKISMLSRAVENMTANEIKECKVGVDYHTFPQLFTEVMANYDSLENVYY